MNILCTFKLKIESQTLDHGCIKDQWPYPNLDQDAKPRSGASSILQSPKKDLKDMDVLCTFKFKIERQNLEHGCIKDQSQYPNQDQDDRPQSWTSIILQSSNWGLKGQGCSFHLQNWDREQKFWSWVYQRQVTISKSRSICHTQSDVLCTCKIKIERQNLKYDYINDNWPYPFKIKCQTSIRNLQCAPKP